MTEVLPAPAHTDGPSYFSRPSSLRRSPQSSFLVSSPDSYTPVPADSRPRPQYYPERLVHSAPSTAPSSPRPSQSSFAQSSSFLSTPASSLSLDTKVDEPEEDDQIIFPSYDDSTCPERAEDLDAPAQSPVGHVTTGLPPSDERLKALTATQATPSGRPSSSRPNAGRTGSPDLTIVAEDDTAVRNEPSRHVDYLSHDWREEDIWSSWRHIVSKRKEYGNSARLENASWRSWTKAKYRLKTVSPETLNWLKDCDVTWLYGPLQTYTARSLMPANTPSGSRLSTSNSFLDKKPILKKRSMSEVMLQRSISASSLLKQAAAAVQAQQSDVSNNRIFIRTGIGRAASDFIPSTLASTSVSDESSGALPSASSSGLQTPGTCEKRHIHFNDKVEQCIAVEVKDGDDEDEDEEDRANAISTDEDESEDDGLIMMKRSSISGGAASSKARISARTTPRNSFSGESRTIAMLPSTTLKYREDTPERMTADPTRLGRGWTAQILSPSASQETLRPSQPSANFLLDEDDEEDMSWEPSATFGRRFDDGAKDDGPGGRSGSGSGFDAGPDEERAGLRRTPSGMFMPYEEDEDDVVAAGLFGRVVDTVNTAKDIAHVIWNVGWRR